MNRGQTIRSEKAAKACFVGEHGPRRLVSFIANDGQGLLLLVVKDHTITLVERSGKDTQIEHHKEWKQRAKTWSRAIAPMLESPHHAVDIEHRLTRPSR